jgi:hypothetical protein
LSGARFALFEKAGKEHPVDKHFIKTKVAENFNAFLRNVSFFQDKFFQSVLIRLGLNDFDEFNTCFPFGSSERTLIKGAFMRNKAQLAESFANKHIFEKDELPPQLVKEGLAILVERTEFDNSEQNSVTQVSITNNTQNNVLVTNQTYELVDELTKALGIVAVENIEDED